MSLLKERVLNNSYKAYIKNLVGSKKEIIINDNNTIEDLKIIVIKKLFNTNVKKLLENFPYYIIYKGCRINKEYNLNTTMKELGIKEESVFYIIDDMDCKKLIEKASSMVLTPPISLASSNIIKKNINKEKEKDKDKNKNKQVRSYSDGCFKSLENPNLSPSRLSLKKDKKTTRNRYNSISAIENDDSSTYSSQELNSSNDIIGLSQLSLLNSNSNINSSVNTSYSDNSINSINTEYNNNENKYRKRNNSRSKRERVLSKFHPPQLNKELENNELLDDDIFDINNNEINNNHNNNEEKIELDKSQELILEALQNMPNSSILLSSSQLPSPPPPSPPPPLTKEMSEQLQKTINTSLDEIKNIKLSQSKITEKFEKTQEYMLEIKKELENNNKNDGEKKTQIDSDISTIKDNFTSLNNSNVLALNNNIEVNNTILSYLKKINTENSNIEEIKNEYSKQIIEQINNKFTEKILKTYKNIIKDKEEQIQNQQQELYITKGISVISSGLLIVLLFFQIISSAYK
jgi:hypothetical protein